MKVYGYIRVSGQGQIEGDGFARQKSAICQFCEAHHIIFEECFQEQVTGTSEAVNRDGFSEMMSKIYESQKDGDPIRGIVVERMDRLARDLMVSEVLLKECREHGVKVFSADQGAMIDMASDGGDPTRVLIRQIMGALAQWEKSNLVKKLAAARARKKAKTGRCEGYAPLRELPGGQAIIDVIHRCHQSGMAESRIARLLNDEGYKTRMGKEWTRFSVRYAINNNKPTERKMT